MKISHVIYKANNLENSINQFRNEGFNVEYGSKINPHNALIYFSEGPYIELLHKQSIPYYMKVILRLMGKGKVVDRLESWGKQKEGFIEICLETHDRDFRKEEAILKNNKQKYFITKTKRLDPSNRLLEWKLLFPYESKIPFFMTYFNIDPKPKNYIHPNGVKKIKRISFGTKAAFIPIVKELCNDDTLELFVGNGVKSLIYDRNDTSIEP